MAAETIERTTPPDTRGPSSPLSAGTLGLGIASVVTVLVGTAVVQARYALAGGPLTPVCNRYGLLHFVPKPFPGRGIKGAEGVCHIVEGLRSGGESAVLVLAILVGAGVVA